jgi:GAF domain-containing protein
MIENFAMLTTILVALITAVLGPIAVNWFKLKMEKKDISSPMRDALETSSLIDTQLEQLVEELECDRVWIAQFHNGGYFYPTGRSIQKFSIFYEKCTPETPNIQTTFQNIPVSLFPRVLSKIYKDNEISIDDVSIAEDSYGLEYMTTQFGTKSICMVGLHSLDNHLIGILTISFQNSHHLSKEEWIYIRHKVGVIGTLLSEYLYTTLKK